MNLPNSQFINASYSLPFCTKNEFEVVWNKISNSLVSGGVFAGHFFGATEDKNNEEILFLVNREELNIILKNFEIFSITEEQRDFDKNDSETIKRHVFDVVARKV